MLSLFSICSPVSYVCNRFFSHRGASTKPRSYTTRNSHNFKFHENMNLKYVAECQLLMGIKGLAWVNKEKQRVENQVRFNFFHYFSE